MLQPEPNPTPRPAPLPRPPSKRKVIAFPRQASEAPPTIYRLADPVVPEQPRILDVPEELEAFPGTPLLDGLHFSASPQPDPTPAADHIELPFQAVSISQRLYAGLIDCALVGVAAGIFGAVVYKMLPKLPLTKPLVLAAAAVPLLLWAVYQYLLTVYGGGTAGMQVAKISLSTFKGKRPNRRHRRSRVIGLYFSTASLLMGLLWALRRRGRALLARPYQPNLPDQPAIAAGETGLPEEPSLKPGCNIPPGKSGFSLAAAPGY